MNTARLISQLLDVEQALGKVDTVRIRGMLFEAQESVIELEKEMIQILSDNEGLQMLMEFSRHSWGSAVPEARTPEKMLIN